MSLRICSLASGSSGNCYMIRTKDTVLLVDAGLSGRQIAMRLEDLDIDISQVAGVLITHEHSDHIKGLTALTKLNRRIFATHKTFVGADLDINENLKNEICSGESFTIGDIDIESFSTSHDANDPVGYTFTDGNKTISIVTDTGCVTETIKKQMRKADILVLESNHDENVLKLGPYPWFLKQRILSARGHLSNDAASQALAEIVSSEHSERMRLVLLAHLSKENNFPEMALATMENILREYDCSPRACNIEVLSRNEVSKVYE